jgi:RNA polymerase sigma-70 factor (ECF subfamily)
MGIMLTRDVSVVTRQLFEQHGAAIYRFAVLLLRHHQDAEDVVQETFLKLLRHVGAGGNLDNVRGWLFTVAAHAARDRQRRRMRWIPWAADHDTRVAPCELPDEDGRLAFVRESLRRLSPRDRLLLVLRAHDLSYRDIAAAARIRPESVGTLLARAVARWKAACDRSGRLGNAHGIKPERHHVL